MPSASALRSQVEDALAARIPSALTPAARMIREVSPTGIVAVDDVLQGGLPLGALTELIGSECSGRTALALSFLARVTQAERVCAWVDVSNALSPESAAASGVDLKRLLWVRCGVPLTNRPHTSTQGSFALAEKYLVPPTAKKGLHGGGLGLHPRSEVRGMSEGVSALLHPANPVEYAPRCPEPQPTVQEGDAFVSAPGRTLQRAALPDPARPWARIEQALRVTDLLLQAGGFGALVLDLGSIAPQHVLRIPLATWFRYGAAAERTKTSILLLTQHACSKSSAGLVLRLHTGEAVGGDRTVLTGLERHVEVSRQRFTEAPAKVVPLRKPPQRSSHAAWQSTTSWAGTR